MTVNGSQSYHNGSRDYLLIFYWSNRDEQHTTLLLRIRWSWHQTIIHQTAWKDHTVQFASLFSTSRFNLSIIIYCPSHWQATTKRWKSKLNQLHINKSHGSDELCPQLLIFLNKILSHPKVSGGRVPWWSSGWDSALPVWGGVGGARAPSLIPGRGTRSHMPQLKTLHGTTKTQHSQINKKIFLETKQNKNSNKVSGNGKKGTQLCLRNLQDTQEVLSGPGKSNHQDFELCFSI